MIDKLSIRRFKSLGDVQMDLERFTTIVGPNASGKTSILQALHLLCNSFQAQHAAAEGEILAGVSRGADSVELAAETCGRWYRFRSRSLSSPVKPHRHGQPWPGFGRGESLALDSADWKPWTAQPQKPGPFPSCVLLQLEASKLISPRPAAPEPAVMAPDGAGLHAALANMALNDPDSWQRLQEDLRRIIPTIRRLRHTRTTANQPAALLFDSVAADSLQSHQVSEGTLLVLGLLTALHGPDRPNLILLDDLDRGLHPKAQKDLIALLRGVQEAKQELQLIATTHSPYMLDSMAPNEVRMTILREDGSTACAPLASHPKFEMWKDEMAPGELWSLFGEKWQVEQEIAS